MLYDRIIGRDDFGHVVPNRIAPEVLSAVASEYARDILTLADARAALEALGAPLDTDEEAEAATLLGTVTGTAIAKLTRYLEIRDVLFLARLQAPGYCRPSEVKARLGV